MKFNRTKIRGNGIFLIKYSSSRYEIVYKMGEYISDWPHLSVTESLEDSDVLRAEGWAQIERFEKRY